MATTDEQKQDPNETDRDSVSEREREGDPVPRRRRAEDQPAPRARLTAEEKKTLAERLTICSEFVSDQVCGSDDWINRIPMIGPHIVNEWGAEVTGDQFTVHTGVKNMEYELVFVRKEELDKIESEKPWAVWRLNECAEGYYAPK
jgi:hypothetical protein